MDGVGVHEVVIGSPIHNQRFPFLDDKQVEELLLAYRERYLALREDNRIKLIIIFKNHGKGLGPLWSIPIRRLSGQALYHPISGENWKRHPGIMTIMGVRVYCDLIEEELSIGKRIVMDTEKFVVLHPYASRFPLRPGSFLKTIRLLLARFRWRIPKSLGRS